MTRHSIPALLAAAFCAVGAVLLATLGLAPAGAQQAKSCPATLPNDSAELTCLCSDWDRSSAIWGTDFYTDDSNLCKAALHAGAIEPGGGMITVRAQGGRESYAGSLRNGIASSEYGRWGRTIVFAGTGSHAYGSSCPSTYNANGTDWSGTCQCNGDLSGAVWGSGPYTADSSLCRAARHAGVIGTDGGTVRVSPAPGQSSYAGSTRNGITTSDWGSYGASFRVSR